MSYFLGLRTTANLLQLVDPNTNAPLFMQRQIGSVTYDVAPANPRTVVSQGLWVVDTQFGLSTLRVGAHSYNFSAGGSMNGFSVLSTAMWWVIEDQLNGARFFQPVPETPEKRSEMRRELYDMLRQDPYGVMNLTYLQRYRKALKITLADLESNVGYKYTTILHAEEGVRHIIPRNWRTIGWDNYLTPTDLFNKLQSVYWPEILRARPEEPETSPLEVLRYSTKVQDVLQFNLEPGKPYIGIEIELEAKSSVSTSLNVAHQHIGKHAIFKGDGSINSGFEIVTKPDLWKNHRAVMEPFFTAIKDHMEARSNCGIHIHLSRSGLSFLQLAKMLEFVNSPNNREFVYHIAGRRENHYCMPRNEINITSAGRNLNNGNARFGDRYQAINLQNSATIEFRIFASTTNFDSFLKYMQFVVALREYTAPGATSLSPKAQITYTEFVKWLSTPENRKEYPQLLAASTAFQPQ